MPSVYCTQCGHPNPEDARFCSRCGSPLSPPAHTQAPPNPYSTGQGFVPDNTSTISLEAIEEATGQGLLPDRSAIEQLPPGTALLVVMRGPNAGSRFLLDSDLTTAGRHPESDIFLDDVTVSRRHAEFYRRGGQFTARDVGSLNGTYVNRERIEEFPLAGGDEVQIGKFRLVFLTRG
ncbi:FHA domain-containing protein [Herbidospora sp. RD11066]